MFTLIDWVKVRLLFFFYYALYNLYEQWIYLEHTSQSFLAI